MHVKREREDWHARKAEMATTEAKINAHWSAVQSCGSRIAFAQWDQSGWTPIENGVIY